MHLAPFPHEYLSEQEYNERMKQKSKRKKNEIDEDNDNSNLYHTSQKFGSYKNMTAERESRVMSAIAYQDVDKPLLRFWEMGFEQLFGPFFEPYLNRFLSRFLSRFLAFF